MEDLFAANALKSNVDEGPFDPDLISLAYIAECTSADRCAEMVEYLRKNPYYAHLTEASEKKLFELDPDHVLFKNHKHKVAREIVESVASELNSFVESVAALNAGSSSTVDLVELPAIRGQGDPNEERKQNLSSATVIRMAQHEKQKGNECFRAGEYAEALEYYSASIKFTPQDVVLYTNKAMTNLKLEHFADAETDCNEALVVDDTYWKAFWRRGQARAGQFNSGPAVSDYETALKFCPSLSQRRLIQRDLKKLQNPGSGKKQKKQQQTKKKKTMIQEEKLEPLTVEPQFTRVQITEVSDSDEDSDDEEEVVITVSLRDRGNEACLIGDYQKAIDLYTEAIEATPTDAVLYTNRAFAYEKFANYQGVIADCTVALSLPVPVEKVDFTNKCKFRRAVAYTRLNQLDEALTDYKTMGATAPSFTELAAKFKAIGVQAFKQQNYIEAEAAFSKGLAAEPTNVALLSNRAFIYLKTNEPANALEDCEGVLELEPSNKKALYRRGQAFEGLRNYKRAEKDYQKYIQKYPRDASLTVVTSALKRVQLSATSTLVAAAAATTTTTIASTVEETKQKMTYAEFRKCWKAGKQDSAQLWTVLASVPSSSYANVFGNDNVTVEDTASIVSVLHTKLKREEDATLFAGRILSQLSTSSQHDLNKMMLETHTTTMLHTILEAIAASSTSLATTLKQAWL